MFPAGNLFVIFQLAYTEMYFFLQYLLPATVPGNKSFAKFSFAVEMRCLSGYIIYCEIPLRRKLWR